MPQRLLVPGQTVENGRLQKSGSEGLPIQHVMPFSQDVSQIVKFVMRHVGAV